MTLPPIYWQVFIAAPPERVYDTLATARGWDGWFTHGATLDDKHITLAWRGTPPRHRVTLWGQGHVDMEMSGDIVAREPNRRFAFTWTPAGHPTTVDFTLAPRGSGTVMTVTESGYVEHDLGATGVVGEMVAHAPYQMCASGWGEALMLLKVYLEHGITYGDVPPA